MNTVVLLTGSNAGDRLMMLNNAAHHLEANGIHIKTQSEVYETQAWGLEDQPDFLNQVLKAETGLSPRNLLDTILSIEHQMGRVRNKKWEQRCIDIDILFFNKEIIEDEGLKIPHPHLQERRFVLMPMHEIMPDYIHPVLKESIAKLLAECRDEKNVIIFK